MLPFLAKNKTKSGSATGLIVQDRPSDTTENDKDEQVIESIEVCATELLLAIQKRDVRGMAKALHYAHEIMHTFMDQEKEPETVNFHTQNESAAKERF